MRSRYIYDKHGNLIYEQVGDEVKLNRIEESKKADFHVMPDVQPFRSMIDGSIINSRSRYRQHLKQHGCVEVGNDSSLHSRPKPMQSPPGLKQAVIEATNKVLNRR